MGLIHNVDEIAKFSGKTSSFNACLVGQDLNAFGISCFLTIIAGLVWIYTE